MEQTTDCRLRPTEFETICRMVHESCGINLRDGKQELVRARLMKRLRALALADFSAYLRKVRDDASGVEFGLMLDLLTTNKTSFFRESQHFDALKSRIVPELLGRRLRVWSAACSSGEEPYSIAMTLRACLPSPDSFDARILATDISSRMLTKVRAAVYDAQSLTTLPSGYATRFFTQVEHEGARAFKVSDEARRLVSIAKLNLLEAWPMRGPFDVVFCRNAMIYFDKPTQQALVERFWRVLRPGGWFFVGHSESLAGLSHEFEYVQPAAYRKAGA
jgi:chemotaxis protein methyltransferase CheR